MTAITIIGTQWGDEGKGKVIDFLSKNVSYVVKSNGGNNAGHTIVIDNKKYQLRLLPSGFLNANIISVLGNGVVIDVESLFNEIDVMKKFNEHNNQSKRLIISANAHLVAPYHKVLDKLYEKYLGNFAIGTTGCGIGPAYMDKVARLGIRVQDIFNSENLKQKVINSLKLKNELLVKVYKKKPIKIDSIVKYFLKFSKRLLPLVADTSAILNRALDKKKFVLIENSQATLLDIDHGTYPYVTSSNSTVGGANIGSGIGSTRISKVIGIVKAYTTRVGSGPFPTELFDSTGKRLQNIGNEIGVNTGRKRRCGWCDLILIKYAGRINGITNYFLTKLDVLTGIRKIAICIAYKINGIIHKDMPMTQYEFCRVKPIYKFLPGWSQDISKIDSFHKLPLNTQKYVRFIENYLNIKFSAISVGSERKSTILIENFIK